MLVLNDQVKDHLDKWDNDDHSVLESDNDGPSEETSQVERNTSSLNHDDTSTETLERDDVLHRLLMHSPKLHDLETAVCGFVLGIWYCKQGAAAASLSLSRILLLFVAGSFMWLPFRHWREWRKHRREVAIQARRLELAIILGRIGGTPSNKQHLNVSSEMIDVATAFELLLQTIHDAMERLQCATSMQLGLGIWSPSVYRVEQAASASRRCQSAVGSSKTVLAKALLRCLALLGQEEGGCPVVVTLSWLKSARKRLVVAFSEYVWLEEAENMALPAVQLVLRIQEISVYAQAYYGLVNPTASIEQRRSQENAHVAAVDQVAMQLHAAQVALWSYGHEAQEESDDNSSKQEWINRFEVLLKAIRAMQETLDPTSAADQTIKGNKGRKATATPQSKSSTRLSNSFEHEGQASTEQPSVGGLLPDSMVTHQPVDKTLVFSGKGSVQSKRQPSNPAPQSAPISTTQMTQGAMLFQELQTRLSTLDIADEIDVNGEEGEHAVVQEKAPACQKELSQIQSSSMFGVSANLLSELQASIGPIVSKTQQDGFAQTYGN